MGWRGTLRSIEAASRRIEREHQRQIRFVERVARYQQKVAEVEQARFEVEDFEETISRLSGPHRECGEAIDWEAILHCPQLNAPERSSTKEQRARAVALAFRASIWDTILGRGKKKHAELNARIATAARLDADLYEEAYQQYLASHAKWDSNRMLAQTILSGNIEAYEDALYDLKPFIELSDYGCRMNHSFVDAKVVQVAITVDGVDSIPLEIKALTASGKLSTKRMPQSRFNELYQDYVCGAVLRVAREFFAVLPLEWVYCTAYTEMLNPSTGYKEVTPVVSVKMPRSTLTNLNFAAVDASDSLTNFVHRMGFKKGSGLTAIEPLSVDS